jgi:hypothetical protein
MPKQSTYAPEKLATTEDLRRTARCARVRAAAELVAEKRRTYAPQHRGRVVLEVAEELHVSPSTISQYLKYPDRAPGAKPPGVARKRRADLVWTQERVRRAIRAWWDRHGQPPTTMDWSPNQLRQRDRLTLAARMAAWREGWVDLDGSRRPFPRAEKCALKPRVAEVAAERALEAPSSSLAAGGPERRRTPDEEPGADGD